MVKMLCSSSGDGIDIGNRQCVLLITCTKCDRELDQNRSRVPVEVSDPKELMEHPLRIGLSVTATIDTKNEDIAEMPELASTVTSMPAYTSKALVIDTSPIEKKFAFLSHNGRL